MTLHVRGNYCSVEMSVKELKIFMPFSVFVLAFRSRAEEKLSELLAVAHDELSFMLSSEYSWECRFMQKLQVCNTVRASLAYYGKCNGKDVMSHVVVLSPVLGSTEK